MSVRPADTRVTIELDAALSPLARVKMTTGRSGYVHYSLLAKRLLQTLRSADTVAHNTLPGVILPSKGLMIWPEAKVMVYLQPRPQKRIRMEDGEVSELLTLCPLIWVWRFHDQPPHALKQSRLFCAATIPLLPTDPIQLRPWPFGNVHHDGKVCWGAVHTNQLTWAHPEDVDALFWDTRPNTDLVTAIPISDWIRTDDLRTDDDDGEGRPDLLTLVNLDRYGFSRSMQQLVTDTSRSEE